MRRNTCLICSKSDTINWTSSHIFVTICDTGNQQQCGIILVQYDPISSFHYGIIYLPLLLDPSKHNNALIWLLKSMYSTNVSIEKFGIVHDALSSQSMIIASWRSEVQSIRLCTDMEWCGYHGNQNTCNDKTLNTNRQLFFVSCVL